jgi:hypothetical protein
MLTLSFINIEEEKVKRELEKEKDLAKLMKFKISLN